MPRNFLYYGDNLEILRKKIRDESVHLCYIDPPFNSKRNYNQIYNRVGREDEAQEQAFVDTWKWNDQARDGYNEIKTNHEGRFTEQTIELIVGLIVCSVKRVFWRTWFLSFYDLLRSIVSSCQVVLSTFTAIQTLVIILSFLLIQCSCLTAEITRTKSSGVARGLTTRRLDSLRYMMSSSSTQNPISMFGTVRSDRTCVATSKSISSTMKKAGEPITTATC